MNDKQSVALLILGMHRSGTSALTRMLNLLGVEIGGDLQAGDESNVPGYWESTHLVKIHEEILDSAGSSWDDWTQFDSGWHQSPVANKFKHDIINFIKKEFSHTGIFAVKDPRVCRFSSLWFDTLGQLGIRPICLLPIRNPLEVVTSIHRRDRFPSMKSQLLWLRHVLEAEATTRGLERLVTQYNQLLTDWRLVAANISNKFDLAFPQDNETANTKIDHFLQKPFRNHEVIDENLNDDPTILEWVKLTYRALQALTDEAEKGITEKRAIYQSLDKVRKEFNCFSDKYGVVFRFEKEQAKKAGLYAREMKDLSVEQAQRIGKQTEIIDRQSEDIKKHTELIEQQSEDIKKQATCIEQQHHNILKHEQLNKALAKQIDSERTHYFQLNQYANTVALQLECIQNSSTWTFSRPLRFLENNYPRTMHNFLCGLSYLLLPTKRGFRESLRTRQKARAILNADLFDEIFYITRNPEVAMHGEKPLHHWLEVGWKRGLNPNWLFDTTWYLHQRPDLPKMKTDPLTHYMTIGANEGNEPSPMFDSKWYTQQHPEVNASDLSPLAHFFKYGAARRWSPCPLFDYDWYLERSPEALSMKIDPFLHYIQIGCFEGKDPHPNFSNDWYSKNYLSSFHEKVCPLVHYFTVGKKSNLPTCPSA